MFVDVPIRIVGFTSLDVPPSVVDLDPVDGAASLRTRYYGHPETRNHSTDEQLDGESFKLSRQSSRSSGPTPSSFPGRANSGQVDSDGEVDMVVRKASSQYHNAIAESTVIGSSQSHSRNNRVLVNDKRRTRSKTISSIPQSPSSFVKLAQDKLLRMESDSSFAITGVAPSLTSGSHHDVIGTTAFPNTLVDHHRPSLHTSFSRPCPISTSEELLTMQVPSTAERIQTAPVRRKEPLEQGTRPNAGRSHSDTVVNVSPDKPSDVRKRIKELEAKMKGDVK